MNIRVDIYKHKSYKVLTTPTTIVYFISFSIYEYVHFLSMSIFLYIWACPHYSTLWSSLHTCTVHYLKKPNHSFLLSSFLYNSTCLSLGLFTQRDTRTKTKPSLSLSLCDPKDTHDFEGERPARVMISNEHSTWWDHNCYCYATELRPPLHYGALGSCVSGLTLYTTATAAASASASAAVRKYRLPIIRLQALVCSSNWHYLALQLLNAYISLICFLSNNTTIRFGHVNSGKSVSSSTLPMASISTPIWALHILYIYVYGSPIHSTKKQDHKWPRLGELAPTRIWAAWLFFLLYTVIPARCSLEISMPGSQKEGYERSRCVVTHTPSNASLVSMINFWI